MTIDPQTLPVPKRQMLLQSAVTPRPIAFASTIDKEGRVNLSPFSFFNMFGANPPLLIFSPARRSRDNTVKHTYENVLEVQEVVINVVNYAMVQQASLASCEYPKGVNEFEKAGFTELKSVKVAPPRVAEAPVQLECQVLQVVPTGDEGGAGILVICEVVMIHIRDGLLNAQGVIDPYQLDAVARLGGDYYCRVQGDAIFEVPKPLDKTGIGIDRLPEAIRLSTVLSGNDLGMLANVEAVPARGALPAADAAALDQALREGQEGVHRLAKIYLSERRVAEAWQVLLAGSGT